MAIKKRMRRFQQVLENGRQGAVRSVRLGYNPNSSSLGLNVTLLVYGALALLVVTPVAAVTARLILKRRVSLPTEDERSNP